MGKTIGLLLLVMGVWTAVEIATWGVDGAFDGALASFAGDDAKAAAAERRSTPQRAGAAVQRAHQEHEARYDDLLPE